MRQTLKYCMLALAVTTVFAVQVQGEPDPPGRGDKPVPAPQKVPRPVPLPIPGGVPSANVPPDGVSPTPEQFRGPNVPLTVSIRGDGAVRWGPNGFCGTAVGEGVKVCDTTVKKGAKLKFEAEPRPGVEFGGWSGACSYALRKACFVTANDALSVGAVFTTKTVSTGQVTVSVEVPYAGGTVKPATFANGDINCAHLFSSTKPGFIKGTPTGKCSMKVDKGSDVSLNAVSDIGGKFNSWANCPKVTGTNCDFTADQDIKLTANFGPNAPYTLIVKIMQAANEVVHVQSANTSTPRNDVNFVCKNGQPAIVGGPILVTCTASGVQYGPLQISTYRYAAGTTKLLKDGKIAKWEGCPEAFTNGICSINMNQNRSMSLSFK